LHQQSRALTAEPCAGGERHPFLFGCQSHGANFRIIVAKLDQPGMPGIRHVTDLADFRRL
jgi:hypothetical protein